MAERHGQAGETRAPRAQLENPRVAKGILPRIFGVQFSPLESFAGGVTAGRRSPRAARGCRRDVTR
jgi:hypothetical protein